MAIYGVTLHLFQFRFGATQPCDLCPLQYLNSIWPGIMRLGFFWVQGPCKSVPVRDIYRLVLDVFARLK